MKKITLEIIIFLIAVMPDQLAAQNVWTQHNDQARTGWYPYEQTLNTNNVNKNTFGLNFYHTTDGRIMTQPLIVMNVNIPGVGIKNIVYVTTLNNTVYAYDADVNASPYWQQNYTNKIISGGPDCSNCRPAQSSDIHPSLCTGSYYDISGNMGIIGAPVIDTTAGTMYFVTKIVNLTQGEPDNHTWSDQVPNDEYTYPSTQFHQYLHAIDITTGLERANSPVEIKPTVNGVGDGQVPDGSGTIVFNPRTQFNRAGLVLANGLLYIAFAAHCDFNPSHGWIVSYDPTSLTLKKAFVSTPNDGRGGIWMSGTAPAVDENGNIYFTTGNSLNEAQNKTQYHTFNTAYATDPANRGESVVKLAPDLTLSSYFTPFDYIALNDADLDFGTQVMLIPGTNLAMTAAKNDTIYVMDKTNLGGFDPYYNYVVQKKFVQLGAYMHSTFAYFGGSTPYVYQYSENTPLKAYPATSSGLGTEIVNNSIFGPKGATGGYLSVSSKGSDPNTGVLWAYQASYDCNANNAICSGVLHAVNASDVTKELWNSDMVSSDQINVFNKMACPTIALGKVYLATNVNQLSVYGLKTNTTCINNIALNKPVTAGSEANGHPAVNANDGDLNTSWRVNYPFLNTDNITIDLGASYDICKIAIYWENSYQGQDFDLQVSDDNTNWRLITSVRGNSASYTEYNGPSTGRYVRMQGVTIAPGSAGYGMEEFQIYGNPASACRTPSGLIASTITPNSEHLTWDITSSANQYIVKYRPNLSQGWLTRTVSTNSVDLTALSCGVLYYYTVEAVCGGVSSGVSQGSFTPDGCPANSCDPLPVRVYNVDLGDIGVAGNTCRKNTIYTITGSGTDIGSISDEFQFAYTNIDNNDYTVSGKILSQDQVNASNKIGLMVRDSLTSTSRFAYLASIGSGYTIIFEYRDVAGNPVTTIAAPGHYSLPYWFKITKTGTLYAGYISPDNVNWTLVGQAQLNFGSDPANVPNYGMAETSVNNNAASSGLIDKFSLDQNSTPLGILLQSLTAKKIDADNVLVSWTTSMEHLTDHFELMRGCDNKGFKTIDTVLAAGESNVLKTYSVVDNAPCADMNYYQLKEIDKDGKSYLSPVVSVNFSTSNGISIYPNPASNYTTISSPKEKILEVSVYNVTSSLIQNIKPADEQQTLRLDVSGLSRGVYFISVKTTNGLTRQKFFKD